MRRNSTKNNHSFFPHRCHVTINIGFILLPRLGIPDAVHPLQNGTGGSKYFPQTTTSHIEKRKEEMKKLNKAGKPMKDVGSVPKSQL